MQDAKCCHEITKIGTYLKNTVIYIYVYISLAGHAFSHTYGVIWQSSKSACGAITILDQNIQSKLIQNQERKKELQLISPTANGVIPEKISVEFHGLIPPLQVLAHY